MMDNCENLSHHFESFERSAARFGGSAINEHMVERATEASSDVPQSTRADLSSAPAVASIKARPCFSGFAAGGLVLWAVVLVGQGITIPVWLIPAALILTLIAVVESVIPFSQARA